MPASPKRSYCSSVSGDAKLHSSSSGEPAQAFVSHLFGLKASHILIIMAVLHVVTVRDWKVAHDGYLTHAKQSQVDTVYGEAHMKPQETKQEGQQLPHDKKKKCGKCRV